MWFLVIALALTTRLYADQPNETQPTETVRLVQFYDLCLQRYEAGRWEEAATGLRQFMAHANPSPRRSRALFLLAECHVQLDQLEEALEILNQFQGNWDRLNAHAAPACYRRGEVLYRLGEDPAAIEQLQQFLKLYQYDARYTGFSYCLLTRLAKDSQLDADASHWFRCAMDIAAKAAQDNELDLARAIYDQLASNREDCYCEILWQRGQLEYAASNFVAAAGCFAMVARRSSTPTQAAQATDWWANSWRQEGRRLMECREYAAARQRFEALLAEPRFTETEWGAWAYYGIGQSYFAESYYEEAARAYMAVAALYDQRPGLQGQCLELAADCYQRLRLPEIADSLRQRARKFLPAPTAVADDATPPVVDSRRPTMSSMPLGVVLVGVMMAGRRRVGRCSLVGCGPRLSDVARGITRLWRAKSLHGMESVE